MIVYSDETIIKPFTHEEISQTICRLIAFCRINKGSKQVERLQKQLERLEEAISTGEFNS